MSLSSDLAPHTSSHKDVTENVLIFTEPTTPLNHYCEFEVGIDVKNASKLDISMTPEVERRDLDDSKDISQETCEEKIEPTILEFDDDVLFIEYESFLCGFDINVCLDVDLCAEYASFSFHPIQIDLLFKSCKSELVESESIATETSDLDQTLA